MYILTVIIRDESPIRHLNEPCTYRTVNIALTPVQESVLKLKENEAINQSFLQVVGHAEKDHE